MTAYRHISVEPVAGTLGAEIHNVNLRNLNDAEFAEIRAALLEHQVIFFRDQELTRDQHKAFGRRFGALHVHPFLQPLKTVRFLIFVGGFFINRPFLLCAPPSSALREEDSVPLRSDLRVAEIRAGAGLRCEAEPEFGARKLASGAGRCERAEERRRVSRRHRVARAEFVLGAGRFPLDPEADG